MSNYIDTVNGQNCNIDIQGGDESDDAKAENAVMDLSETGLTLEQIAGKVHEMVTKDWYDPNGFSIAIVPMSEIDND